MTTDSYDEIPYDSTPFADTHPEHLCVLGRLFGVDAPAPETARILELGCATGGNIIPLAWYLPDSQITGIELSAGQVAVAQELIKRLALTNITVRQGDIMALSDELGQFDYIIVHGVYSWVPEAVRERILELCRKHLAPQGIAYISYNTLPGWRMRGTLRDMLLHHTHGATAPRDRLLRAYHFLDRMAQAISADDSLTSRYLHDEIAALRKSHPSYLYHEYLEEINQPFLFSEFVTDVQRHGLNYLCDVELATDIPSTLGTDAAAMLDEIDGFVEQGQYADFVTNRYFRRSLLCHADVPLQRELSLEQLTRFACCALLIPGKAPAYKQPRSQSYRSATNQSYEIDHPLTKAALHYLSECYPDAIAFDELYSAAKNIVIKAGSVRCADERDALLGELFSLFAHQALRLTPRARRSRKAAMEQPRLTRLAQAQIEMKLGHLATPNHNTLSLDQFSIHLAEMLDGSRTFNELVEQMTMLMEREVLAGKNHGQKIAPSRLKAEVTSNLRRLLATFAREGVLEGDPGQRGDAPSET